MSKEHEILTFLDERVFEPALNHPRATEAVKAGVRLTRTRLAQRNAAAMRHYFWSAVVGTEKSVPFARQMRELGLTRFEEVIDEFRERFTDDWLAAP